MPKVVDHGERRRELLDAVTRVIVRSGLDGATTRAIAKESGWSTGSLQHYFSDRDDILANALRYSHEVIRSRWSDKLGGLKGVDALRELMLDNLPLDEERRAETRLEMIFWSQALHSAHLRDIQRKEATELYERTAELVAEAQSMAQIDAKLSVSETTERLLALVDGISLHALLYDRRMPASLVEELAEAEINALRAEVRPGRGHIPAKPHRKTTTPRSVTRK